jgi:hypothetical protein
VYLVGHFIVVIVGSFDTKLIASYHLIGDRGFDFFVYVLMPRDRDWQSELNYKIYTV